MLSVQQVVCDPTYMHGREPLRGQALYEAFMRLKPAALPETDWAVQAGVNRGFFSNLKGSEILPRSDNVTKLLRHIGKSEADLHAPSTSAASAAPLLTIDDIAAEHGFAFLEELDLTLGMGATYLDGSAEVLGLVPFKLDWLRGVHEGALGHLKVVRGKGDSMEPAIFDGDIVVVDTAKRRIDDQDALWALAYGDLGMIRRVRQRPNGSWVLMAEKATVRDEIVGDGEVAVIGKVVWSARRY